MWYTAAVGNHQGISVIRKFAALAFMDDVAGPSPLQLDHMLFTNADWLSPVSIVRPFSLSHQGELPKDIADCEPAPSWPCATTVGLFAFH